MDINASNNSSASTVHLAINGEVVGSGDADGTAASATASPDAEIDTILLRGQVLGDGDSFADVTSGRRANGVVVSLGVQLDGSANTPAAQPGGSGSGSGAGVHGGGPAATSLRSATSTQPSTVDIGVNAVGSGSGANAGTSVSVSVPTTGSYRPTIGATGGAPTSAAGGAGGAIPVSNGNMDVTLGIGQTTYRQVELAGGKTYAIPQPGDHGGLGVEVFAVRRYKNGAHDTEVLVPVSGKIALGPGESARLVVRLTGLRSGEHSANLGFGTASANVTTTRVKPLSMMTWVNNNEARERGADQADVERVLQNFGMASGGVGGARTNGANMDKYYLSAAWEAATRQPPAQAAKMILEAEARLQKSNPNAKLWVQVSDEQDTTTEKVNGTVAWIKQLRQHLNAGGSDAKLFVACQARDNNIQYSSVIDGWATTQSTIGANSRANSINLIKSAGQRYGRDIELMQYPGNAFFDGSTPGGAAVSVASAGLDGSDSWFYFAANNLSTLESGSGEEGRGDIGGLVAIHNGSVLPTLSLAEAEYGANLAGAARATGSAAGASSVRSAADRLDRYQTGHVPDFGAWERELSERL